MDVRFLNKENRDDLIIELNPFPDRTHDESTQRLSASLQSSD